jgi:hypothetical protein
MPASLLLSAPLSVPRLRVSESSLSNGLRRIPLDEDYHH